MRPTRLERATYGFEVRCSIQSSYERESSAAVRFVQEGAWWVSNPRQPDPQSGILPLNYRHHIIDKINLSQTHFYVNKHPEKNPEKFQKKFKKIIRDNKLALANLSSNYKKNLEKLIGIVYNRRIWEEYLPYFFLPSKQLRNTGNSRESCGKSHISS